MRTICAASLVAAVIALAGCSSKPFDGPTVDKFNGRLVHDGKPVTFPAEETVQLKLFHEKAESFIIPIKPDGSFDIGWMPIGKYSATLTRAAAGASAKGGPRMNAVPGGLTIADGQTEYEIELGKDWKP
jgi:hypothetical protein